MTLARRVPHSILGYNRLSGTVPSELGLLSDITGYL